VKDSKIEVVQSRLKTSLLRNQKSHSLLSKESFTPQFVAC